MGKTNTRNEIDSFLFRRQPNYDWGNRWQFWDNFNKRPILQASLEPSTVNQAAVREIVSANDTFALSGTSGIANSDVQFSEFGGIVLNTKASSSTNNDTSNIVPTYLTGPILHSALFGVTQVTGKPWQIDLVFRLPSVAGVRLLFGVRDAATLPATAADETSGNDFCMLGFSTGSSVSATRFRRVTKVGGGTVEDVALSSDIGAVAASTVYRARIEVTKDNRSHFYIQTGRGNFVKGGSGPAMGTGTFLSPFVTIQRLATAAKSVILHGFGFAHDLHAAF